MGNNLLSSALKVSVMGKNNLLSSALKVSGGGECRGEVPKETAAVLVGGISG